MNSLSSLLRSLAVIQDKFTEAEVLMTVENLLGPAFLEGEDIYAL